MMENEEKKQQSNEETESEEKETKTDAPSSDDTPSKEELENDLKRVMEEIKRQQQKNKKKGPKQRVFAIEFGGVYHTNQMINFIFGYLLNLTLIFLVIELFNFASYDSLYVLLGVTLVFSVLEALFRVYVFSHHFKWILRTFGTLFYFAYVIIFYAIDRYLFVESFRFVNETLLVFFVLIFALLRYGVGMMIRRYLRQGLRR